MSQFRSTSYLSGIAAGAIPQHSRIKITGKLADGGFTIDVAGLAERTHGIAQDAAYAAGDEVAFRLLSDGGTQKVIAVEAVAIGATLYTEANGKYQDTAQATSLPELIALEAATADGDIIEAMPIVYGGPAAS